MSALILPFRGILPRIHPSAFIADGAVLVGDVEVGEDSSIWFGCILRGDMGPIRVGKRVNIQDGSVLHITEGGQGTFVGDGATVGHMALLHDCTVDPGAFIGMRAVLMDGSCVESGGMLAAGAVLTPRKRVLSGQIWAGSPAKYWRDVTGAEKAEFSSRADEYVRLASDYREARNNNAA